MKKTLLFLSILFATILLGGCDKETISLVDTKWVDSGDFGGFKYEQYCLTFSTDDKVTLEIYSGTHVVKTVNGTYNQRKRGEAELKGLEWQEDDLSFAYLTATIGKNALWVHVKRGDATFYIDFDQVRQ